jgi:hypothetical protein
MGVGRGRNAGVKTKQKNETKGRNGGAALK